MGNAILGLAAFAALAFGNGKHALAGVAWLAPLLMVRFVRTRSGARGLLVAWALMAAAWVVGWNAILRAPPVVTAVGAVIAGGLALVPYLLDRWAAKRLPAWAALLVFPSALVAHEFLLATTSPLGAWGMLAYTQAGIAPIAQLVAWTGLFGVAFLIGWTATVGNAIWAARAEPARWRNAALVLATTLLVVVALGGWRATGTDATPGVRVAMVLPPVEANANYDAARAGTIEHYLRQATLREARAGAKLVAWPEDSLFLPLADEPLLLARAAALARGQHVHLALAYGARVEPGSERYRNTSVLVDPDGNLAWHYFKSHAVPGYEEKYMVPGDGRVPRAATPFGTVAGMICFDGDHRRMLRQLDGADLLLLPSDDWPAIEALHAAMAKLRAIELGIALVRPTINGRSVAFDARGRELAMLPGGSAGQSLVVTLPTTRLRTGYALFGDAFAWACVAVLAALLAWGAIHRER